jgi:hypothetical protein
MVFEMYGIRAQTEPGEIYRPRRFLKDWSGRERLADLMTRPVFFETLG